jgi:hypothetical protein
MKKLATIAADGGLLVRIREVWLAPKLLRLYR